MKVLGMVKIQIPFKGIGLIIEVDFLVLQQEVPTLLSLLDMFLNGLGISVQKCHVSLVKKTHKLHTENFLMVHRWKRQDVPFAIYTEYEYGASTPLLAIHLYVP